MTVEDWIDGWAGNYSWRAALRLGELTISQLLEQLQSLDLMEPSAHPPWNEIQDWLESGEK